MFIEHSDFPLGLDISDLSLKFAQLKVGKNKISPQTLGKIDLESGLIKNGEIINKQAVISKIKELIAKPKFGSATSRDVIACLPDPKTFVKLIGVKKKENESSGEITAELEKYVPVPASELYYDWQLIEENDNSRFILVGAVPKNIVNQYIDLLQSAGLNVLALEPEPLSICRCLLAEESPRFHAEKKINYGIIDIGAKRTSMIVYSKNTVVMSVSMPISGDAITERIAKVLDIDKDQAEKAKIICGLDKQRAQGIIFDILSDIIDDLVEKIKKAIRFYDSHYADRGALDEILLCGGGANVKNIDNVIGKAISAKMAVGDPFVNLTMSDNNLSRSLIESHNLKFNFIKNQKDANLSVTQNSSLTYTTAIGLALRDIFIAGH